MYSVVRYRLVVPYHLSYSFNMRGSSEPFGERELGHFLQTSFFTFQKFYTFLCFSVGSFGRKRDARVLRQADDLWSTKMLKVLMFLARGHRLASRDSVKYHVT